MADIFPQDKPDHPVIGNYFKAHGKGFVGTDVYYCDSYDPSQGFWMTSLTDPEHRTNVSERAIGRTFHTVYGIGEPDGAMHCQWGRLSAEETERVRGHIEESGLTPTSLRF
jgi:hypothetical protein